MEQLELRDRISVRDILEIVFKRKKFITRLFIVTVVLVAIVGIILPDKYEAASQIMLERNVSLTPFVSTRYRSILDRTEEMESQMEFLRSDLILERVADNLGLQEKMREKEEDESFIKSIFGALGGFFSAKVIKETDYFKSLAVLSLKENTETDAELESSVITLRYRSKDPTEAVSVVNDITRTYLGSRKILAERRGTTGFYEEQIAINEQSLKDLSDEIASLKDRAQVSDAETEIRIMLDRINSLTLELNKTCYEMEELRKKRAVLLAHVEALPPELTVQKTMEPNVVIENYREEIARLQTERARIRQSYRPDSRKVKETDARIAELKELVENEPSMLPANVVTGRNTERDNLLMMLRSIEADLSGFEAKKEELDQQIEEIKARPHHIDEIQRQIEKLEKAKKVIEGIIELHINKKEESRILALSDHRLSNASVINYASFAENITPSAILLIILGAIVSLFLGVGLSLVAAFFDHSIDNERDVAIYLELPLLAMIPEKD